MPEHKGIKVRGIKVRHKSKTMDFNSSTVSAGSGI
jgi:hypothetical protein